MQLAVDDRAFEKPMTFDADPAELEVGAGAAQQLLRAIPVTGRGKVSVRLRASSPAGRRGGELLGDPFGRAIGVGDHVHAHGLEATCIKLDELEEGDQVKILYEPNQDGHNDVMEVRLHRSLLATSPKARFDDPPSRALRYPIGRRLARARGCGLANVV